MNIFMTGATGYIGSVVAERLQENGHAVAGLARSEEAVQKLTDRGMAAVSGSVSDLDVLRGSAQTADAVIYAAVEFTPQGFDEEFAAVTALLESLAGTEKPFLFTSGVGVLGNSESQVLDEDSPYNPWPLAVPRVSTEKTIIGAAKDEVRSIVIRPGMVYGRGGSGLGRYVQGAAQLGVAPYIGEGEMHWPVVHVDDLADLFVLALTKAPAGSVIHGVMPEVVRFRDIAEATAQGLQLPDGTASWNTERLHEAFGPMGAVFTVDQRIARSRAERLLGWQASRPTILQELEHGSYAGQTF